MESPDMNHEGKEGMMHKFMHGGAMPHMKGGWIWQNNWKSPVSLGIFLLSASLALAIFLYTVLNFAGVIISAMHPQVQQGMTAQELQQLQQSMPSSGSAMPAGSTGQ